MASQEFIRQRICIFAGTDVDPSSAQQVTDILRNKFNISLPQRRSMDESLAAVASDHEIIDLILQYRSLDAK